MPDLIKRAPLQPIEAARELDEHIKSVGGHENLHFITFFVERESGRTAAASNITDKAMLRALLLEAAGHIDPSPIAAVAPPSLILPH